MRFALSIVSLAGVVCCLAAPARADEPALAAGLAAYESLEYARAVPLLVEARTRAHDLKEKSTIARTLGFAYVALDQPEPACAEFRALLALDPTATLDRTISPRVRAVFERARREAALAAGASGHTRNGKAPGSERADKQALGAAAAGAALTVALTPERARAGQPIALSLPAARGASAQLRYRTRGQVAFAQLGARERDGRIELALPAPAVKSPALEYYLQTVNEDGTPVGTAGSVEHPVAIDVEAARRPVYRRPWFWVTTGGLTIAGAVVGVVIAVVRTSTPAHVTVQAP
jgi:hypothetical protein